MRTSRLVVLAVATIALVPACSSDGDGGDEEVSVEEATETDASAPPAEGSTPTEPQSDAPTEPAGDAPVEPSAGGTEVTIQDFEFMPAEIRVPVGGTIRWTNMDGTAHTVDTAGDVPESDRMGEGDSFELTFEEAGENPYICGIHTYMAGTVIVE